MRKKAKKKAVKKVKKTKRKEPSADGQTDRDNSGQFVNGNKAAVGNEKGTDRTSKWLKKALYDTVTEKDVVAIAKKLVAKAKKGDIPATKELFDRLWGKAMQEIEGEIRIIRETTPKSPEEMTDRLKEIVDAGDGLVKS